MRGTILNICYNLPSSHGILRYYGSSLLLRSLRLPILRPLQSELAVGGRCTIQAIGRPRPSAVSLKRRQGGSLLTLVA